MTLYLRTIFPSLGVINILLLPESSCLIDRKGMRASANQLYRAAKPLVGITNTSLYLLHSNIVPLKETAVSFKGIFFAPCSTQLVTISWTTTIACFWGFRGCWRTPIDCLIVPVHACAGAVQGRTGSVRALGGSIQGRIGSAHYRGGSVQA